MGGGDESSSSVAHSAPATVLSSFSPPQNFCSAVMKLTSILMQTLGVSRIVVTVYRWEGVLGKLYRHKDTVCLGYNHYTVYVVYVWHIGMHTVGHDTGIL